MKTILKMMASVAAVMAVATMVHAARPADSEENAPPTCVAVTCSNDVFGSFDCIRAHCGDTCFAIDGDTRGHCG
jgi:predicted secreted protein